MLSIAPAIGTSSSEAYFKLVATFKSRMQKAVGSNPTQTTDLERSALRIPLGLYNLFRLTE